MLVDDIIAAVEAARDKIMAEEIKSMVKLGLPKNMARQTVAARFHIKLEEEEGAATEFTNGHWRDLG